MVHALLAGLCGCGDKGATPPPAQTCADSAIGKSAKTGGDGRCPGQCRPLEDAFCAASAPAGCPPVAASRPGAQVDICGVPLTPPAELKEAQRSANVDEYAGTGPVDLSCYEPGGYPPVPDPSSSQKVALKGIAKVFSNGCQSNGVEMEMYRVKRTGGADDGEPGALAGSCPKTDADCQVGGVKSSDIVKTCEERWECRYSCTDVPTETELLIKTFGEQWAPLYEYGVFIPNAEVKGGEWEHDVRALANDDYTVIPQVAFGGKITPGNGAVGGEVHDCGNVRVMNAFVDVDADRTILTYFNEDENKPLPDKTRRATSALALYSAMDIPSGPITVAAAGLVGGELRALGFFRARVFGNSITSVTFRGLKPFQVPK
ncbi:MAG: hypothetical protein HY744_26905 [Deltaproteobacteria bacterium]|nr:hypothetical protein [Deltaproteobacteria bacterium]